MQDCVIRHALFPHTDRVLVKKPVDLVHLGVFAIGKTLEQGIESLPDDTLRHEGADMVSLASAILRAEEWQNLAGRLCLSLVQYLHFEPEHRRFRLIFHIGKHKNPLFQQVSRKRFRFLALIGGSKRGNGPLGAPGDALIPGFGGVESLCSAQVLGYPAVTPDIFENVEPARGN
jgi:hypothetical protein